MARKYFIGITAALTLLVNSCSFRIADFTFLSSKNVDMNHAAGYTTSVNDRKQGQDSAHIIIFIPTGEADYKEALDKAIEQNGPSCVGLANAKVESGGWYIPYVYGYFWCSVEGDPVYKK